MPHDPLVAPSSGASARLPSAAVSGTLDRFREQLGLYGSERERDRRSTSKRPRRPGPIPTPPPAASDQPDWRALRQWVDLYCSHLVGLNRAAGTLEAYRRDLRQFFATCQARGLTPRRLKRMDLLSYVASLTERYGASSRARKTIAIRRFFQFLADGDVLPSNPFATVPSPRLERRERRVLSEREYGALRELARRVSPRVGAIVEVLLQTGLRASELCALRLSDVTFAAPGQPGLLLIRQGKGKKDRVVPLNSVAEEALREYLASRDSLRPPSPLFINQRRDTPLSRQGLGSLLDRLYARLGIVGASVHTLRHTFATHSLRKGVSLLVVKEVLGHSSLTSTERYLHLLRETMCAELEKHPL